MKWKTIAQIHQAYTTGQETPETVTEFYLSNISNSGHNAYITVTADRARAQAKTLTEAWNANGKKIPAHQPLFGIPMGIKDNMVMDGVRTTCASKMLENYIPPYTATAVIKLENAGAIILGKLNLDEFAMGSSNENSAFGAVKHPTHPDRVPGGSSGGSAAAVAAELCFAATGSDTGGSIRLPASFCGVPGFKPTYGSISRYGLVAFGSSLDQIGPIAPTLNDCAFITEIMAGFDPMDGTTTPEKEPKFAVKSDRSSLKGLRIGIPKEYFIDGIDAPVLKAVDAALEVAKNAGAVLVPISLPHTSYAVSTYYVVAVSEASSNLSRFDGIRFGVRPDSAAHAKSLPDFYKSVRSNFGPEVKRRIILGTFALSSGYYDAYYRKACQVRRLMRNDFEAAFQHVDVIASPVAPSTAFKLGEKSKDPLKMYLSDIFTIPASLVGLPCLSLPIGKDDQGLPIGLHLIGNRNQDQRLLASACALEQVGESLGWSV